MALGAAGSTMKSSLLHADDAPVDASGKVIAGLKGMSQRQNQTVCGNLSDRKYVSVLQDSLCKFGAIRLQDHPNVEVAAELI